MQITFEIKGGELKFKSVQDICMRFSFLYFSAMYVSYQILKRAVQNIENLKTHSPFYLRLYICRFTYRS